MKRAIAAPRTRDRVCRTDALASPPRRRIAALHPRDRRRAAEGQLAVAQGAHHLHDRRAGLRDRDLVARGTGSIWFAWLVSPSFAGK